MVTLTDERNRILNMIETGQITAAQAAQLLDALVSEQQPVERVRNRTVRIWMTDSATNSKKMHPTATKPINLVNMNLHLLTSLGPQLNDGTVQNLKRPYESTK